jgi:hypothetical protein
MLLLCLLEHRSFNLAPGGAIAHWQCDENLYFNSNLRKCSEKIKTAVQLWKKPPSDSGGFVFSLVS